MRASLGTPARRTVRVGTLTVGSPSEEGQPWDACRTRSSSRSRRGTCSATTRSSPLLPLLSGLSALVVALVFFGPVALIADSGAQGSSKPLVWILGIVGYIAITFVVVFFNAALVFAADKRLRGEPVTIGDAVHAAGARAHVLLPWAV